jgi:hypothetical protein
MRSREYFKQTFGIQGSAWEMAEELEKKHSRVVFNRFRGAHTPDERRVVELRREIAALTSIEQQARLPEIQALVGKTVSVPPMEDGVYIVGLFKDCSPYQRRAFLEAGKLQGRRTFNTHLGILLARNERRTVFHEVRGSIERQSLRQLSRLPNAARSIVVWVVRLPPAVSDFLDARRIKRAMLEGQS